MNDNLGTLKKLLLQGGFDAGNYTNSFPDLKIANLAEQNALDHFIIYGCNENRMHEFQFSLEVLVMIHALSMKEGSAKVLKVFSFIARHLILNAKKLQNEEQLDILLTKLKELGVVLYFVIGDSHSNLFDAEFLFDKQCFVAIHQLCSGGSAGGLNNPKSKSAYGETIFRALTNESFYKRLELPMFFQFGQVDVEFVYLFKRIKNGSAKYDRAAYMKFCDDIAESYCQFISKIKTDYPGNVFLISIFPPALSDSALKQGYVNAHISVHEDVGDIEKLKEALRQLEIPDEIERAFIHQYFNAKLREISNQLNLIYIDAFTPFFSNAGVVSRQFIKSHSGTDHHLDGYEALLIAKNIICQALQKKDE